MSAGWIERFRGLDLERSLGLRAESPRVAVSLEACRVALVRVKRKRRGRPVLETHQVRMLARPGVPATIFENGTSVEPQLGQALRELFDGAGVRPGKVSLVLPDNLAKITLLSLPEWPPSRRQLDEIIRFKMRKTVPFRLEDASLSYQVLPTDGQGITILVALVRRSLIERYEKELESIGARPGLIDLCTPNLLNLCRGRIDQAAVAGGDVALINCADNYFSLAIVRNSKLIFLRCKTFALGKAEAPVDASGLLGREVAGSISYYEEKLEGQGIGTLLVRSAEGTTEEYARSLGHLNVPRVEFLDPTALVEMAGEQNLEADLAQQLAPALGAAVGRG